MSTCKLLAAFAAVLFLQSCGGGGGGGGASDSPAPAPVAQTPAPAPSATDIPSPVAPNCGADVPDTVAAGTLPTNRAKFEPDDGKAYFGFTMNIEDQTDPDFGDLRPLADRLCDSIYYELDGKKPTVIKVQSEWIAYSGDLQPFSVALADIQKVQAAGGSSIVPFVEWEANWAGHDDQNVLSTKEIAAGTFDDYIRSYAQEVIAYGKPLFIRPICGEFNGNWWRWCSPKANPTLTAADFVGAWQHVVDIFREEGVTNVAWVWTPTDALPSYNYADPNWQAYYPGDDYVDWVGGDTYMATTPKIPDIFDNLYQFGVDHRKPFFLAEFGIRAKEFSYPAELYPDWMQDKFNYFVTHPNIKAVMYFNRNGRTQTVGAEVFMYDRKVSYVPNVDDDDFRLLAGGPSMRSLFAREISDSRYLSSLTVPAR